MVKRKNRQNQNFEYEKFAGLNLPLELTDEEREIAIMQVDSAKPMDNIYLWRIKEVLFLLKDTIVNFFLSSLYWVVQKQIKSGVLFILILFVISFLLVLL